MSGFSLNIDLTTYFEDLRKYSSVYVNLSKCKEVRDVENHIITMFGLDDNICLTHKKFLIPRSEDVSILEQYEIIKVQRCDFFDNQIHKNRNQNSTCDQTALNLIQPEKTIDLSCRPKQRLKMNICQSRHIGSPSVSLEDNIKKSERSSDFSCKNSVSDLNQLLQKDKFKNKKKKYHLQNNIGNTSEDDCNGVDILDMSFKKSMEKKFINCFSTDENQESEYSTPSGQCGKHSINMDISDLNSICESQRSSKKRKKPQPFECSLDPATTFQDSLVSDNSPGLAMKKHKKKSKKSNFDSENNFDTVENKNTSFNDCSFEYETYTESSIIDNNKKKKKKKHKELKNLEETCSQNLKQGYFDYFPNNSSHEQNSFESSIPDIGSNQNNDICSADGVLDYYKNSLVKQVDSLINKMDPSSSNSICEKSMNCQDGFVCGKTKIQNSPNENCVDTFLSTDQNSKRKRVRRHNKKKKREKLCAYMSAVGPVLSTLSNTSVTKSVLPKSDVAKHVYFTDDDFEEEMKIPPTPPVGSKIKEQDLCASSNNQENSEDVGKQGSNSDENTATWQEKLLKLASKSKPIVFHRNTPAESGKTDFPFSQTHSSNAEFQTVVNPETSATYSNSCLSENVVHENNEDGKTKDSEKLNQHNSREEAVFQKQNINIDPEHDNNCERNQFQDKYDAREEANRNNAEQGIISEKGQLPVIPIKPNTHNLSVPNDIEKINLTNYPIIDKIVAEDLILFKVLKLNEENSEPKLSKTILAKVFSTSGFPDKVSLQVMEGCEECECKQSVDRADEFMVELRWADMLEPRLFYP